MSGDHKQPANPTARNAFRYRSVHIASPPPTQTHAKSKNFSPLDYLTPTGKSTKDGRKKTTKKAKDPIALVMELAKAGDMRKITTNMLKEALAYSRQLDREIAQQAKAEKAKPSKSAKPKPSKAAKPKPSKSAKPKLGKTEKPKK